MKKIIFLIFLFACSNSTTTNTNASLSQGQFSGFDVSKINQDSAEEKDTQNTTNEITEDIQDEDLPEDSIEQETSVEEDVEQEIEQDLQTICQDEDNDGYGKDCPNGEDCDDFNPNFFANCPDCSKENHPGCLCSVKSAPCYSYDPSTKGVGQCKSGIQLCSGGFWQPCTGETGPSMEVCDFKDNDCDGETDEGVKSSCGNCDLTCSQQSVGGSIDGWNLNSENSSGVGLDPQGKMTLDMTKISLNLKFIWIANSPQNTISKVDCKTIKEVGRFPVCSDPSRTSVDLDGNVWVGCRGDGKVAKIMADKKNCIDKNGNGTIETSTGSQVIQNDECVKFIVQPDGPTIARGAAVDKYNHVWIGFWNTNNLRRLEPENGNVVDTINIGCNPYGLVIDQKEILWAQGAGCGQLVMVNLATKQISKIKYPAGAYGLNVDNKGRIWVASGNNASVYDPKTLQWVVVPMGWGGGRGLATSNDGYVWVAVDSSGGAVKINGNNNPPSVEGFVKGAGNPVGAAIDYDGFVWVVNQGGSSATKIDPKTMAVVGSVPVGSSPYTYSDMTGYTLNYFTAPKGIYTTAFFAGINYNPITTPKTKYIWQSLTAEAELPEGTSLKIRYRTGNTKMELEAAQWSQPVSFPPETFPYDLSKLNVFGIMLQIEVQLITNDKKVSPALKSITAKTKLI